MEPHPARIGGAVLFYWYTIEGYDQKIRSLFWSAATAGTFRAAGGSEDPAGGAQQRRFP